MSAYTHFRDIQHYFLRPARLLKSYRPEYLRPDLVAGLTVAVILLPQAIAFALIAELPPSMGLYAAIIGAIVGALFGSSNHIHTGPTNAISLLVLSVLSTAAITDAGTETTNVVVVAGVMAVMVGFFQLLLGVAGLGLLVNFVSHSVIVGFASGAGVLIAIRQVKHLLGLSLESHGLLELLQKLIFNLLDSHVATSIIGVGTIILLFLLRRFAPKLPASLIVMVLAASAVALFGLDQQGVATIGRLSASLPPIAPLPFDLDLIARLSTGALAVAAIGLVETSAISRSIAAHTGQRLDSNQEFVGQGLSNVLVGIFSGYPTAGSFSRSAVNFKSGAMTPLSALFSGIFVLIAMFTLGRFAAFLPRAALAGVLIVTAYGMIDRVEIRRIWQSAPQDAAIMLVTFLGTLFLHIEFAVLIGIMLSFAVYIRQTSSCTVETVVPDEAFRHFLHQPDRPVCPQLGIISISGDLYFGAVNHIESAILAELDTNPGLRFLLLRLHKVNQCDFSGIHTLESIMHACRERGGDIFLVRVNAAIMGLMEATGFDKELGRDRFLPEDTAIAELFYKKLDPAICIYECPFKVFKECQNLPKEELTQMVPWTSYEVHNDVKRIEAKQLWALLHEPQPPIVIDVRQPREYRQGHVVSANLMPLPTLSDHMAELAQNGKIVLVCRSGRRSHLAAQILLDAGQTDVTILDGGMVAWEAANLLKAVGV